MRPSSPRASSANLPSAAGSSGRWVWCVLIALFVASAPAWSQPVCGNAAGWDARYTNLSGTSTSTQTCSDTFKCEKAKQPSGPVIEKLSAGCDPMTTLCAVRIRVPLEFPGNFQNIAIAGGTFGAPTPKAYWFTGGTPPGSCAPRFNVNCGQIAICGIAGAQYIGDFGEAILNLGNARCSDLTNPKLSTYSLSVFSCESQFSCPKRLDIPNLNATPDKTARALGCPIPRKRPCNDCKGCIATGGCSTSVAGKGPSCKLPGAGAHLYYAAEGAGNTGLPGTAAWSPTLGRNWSHDYAQRIVIDPDDSHVWLIAESATFREFSGLSGGVYGTVSPSDEKRKLSRTAGGWELKELDGTVHAFNGSGLWTSTTDKNGNAKIATYNGSNQLTSVAFPDGRTEVFAYHPSGKLASITEVGVGGSPTRSWGYTWTGDDLTRVDRPDGTAWELFFNGNGLITRWDLVGTDLSRRIEGAWEYDSRGNVTKAWRGDPLSTGANAVELYTFSYDDPILPTQTQVTDPLGKVTTYSIARDTVSDVPKITQITGDCPTCGVGPNSVFTYADAANPLRETQVVDGRGLITQYSYDANGMMTSKTEAVGTPLARTTTWQYANPSFPAFPTRTEMSSTSGGSAQRVTVMSYNATGDLTTHTIQGAEAGGSFSFATTTTYNAAGRPLTVDPPGYAAADQISFTYDPARGGLVALTRTDPLVGATTSTYDGFHRRTSTTDPNSVEIASAYDALNRVTLLTQKGATSAEDQVTTYSYNSFGDLLRTTLPRGNVIEYSYDSAGRLISMERKPNASTPGERTLYTLDSYGHRLKEELQRWNGSAWVTESFTDFVYSTRCQLDKVVHANGSATEYAYDCDGNLERVWDANHPKASNPTPTQLYAYDALNRMTSVTQPWPGGSAVTGYSYDVQDHLTGVTDAEGNVTSYVYSDRDLMTQQSSPVSGTTTYVYNDHGELTSQTDARGITMARTIDALDRVTFADWPDNTLDTTYTYDAVSVPFSKGRLTQIARTGSTIDYTYDRFGRVTQDGPLGYQYDKNGNRTEISYPGGVSALYTHDFADRDATLFYDTGSGPQPLVTSASYKPFGPLTSLSLANGLTEARLFDTRYYPDRIQAGSLLDWDYTEDAVGNPTEITGTIVSKPYTATFAYQDHLYFLTQGNGPWGARSWSYDKIGNRLSSTETGEPNLTYSYAAPGHNPKLAQIAPAPGVGAGSWAFSYDAAGNQTSIVETDGESASQTTFHDVSNDSQLAALRTNAYPGRTDILYDGRGYLREAHQTFTGSTDFTKVTPVYSSEGVVHSRTEERQWTAHQDGGEDFSWTANNTEATHLFYFAGRPVAQLTNPGAELIYLTTDHLGTPILATETTAQAVWAGGLEPFGRVWTAGDNPDPEFAASTFQGKALGRLSAEKVFLRYPGQWASDAFRVGGLRGDLYYNVHRWYEANTGRYTRPDPLALEPGSAAEESPLSSFSFVRARPIAAVDPLGLTTMILPETCPDKWTQRISPGLMELVNKPCCADYFRNEFNADLRELLNPGLPEIRIRPVGRGGTHGCPADGPSNREPNVINIGRDSSCKVKEAMHVVIHELGHYADCRNGNRYPLRDERDGCGAEVACFGFSIGKNCKDKGFPGR